MERIKEFHGGQEVYSKKHGKNICIMLAHHSQPSGCNPTLDYYIMVDGTKVMPDEVEERH
jgi:hypothetical protein